MRTTRRGALGLGVRVACVMGVAMTVACDDSRASEPPSWGPGPGRDVFAARAADWRVGGIVYQVFVDRFEAKTPPASRVGRYPAPRTLRAWGDLPARGKPVEGQPVWSHELDFWGGDLPGLRTRLGHVRSLGAEVLYLNPIHHALTNHKYDAIDYRRVSPEYGDEADLDGLIADLHQRSMRLVLDGVFNHMGRSSPVFQEALADPDSPRRGWFYFDDAYPRGYRAWNGAMNLPELNWENAGLRDEIFGGPDSVVRSLLRRGVDGWRLDTAHEFGLAHLADLTHAAHEARPGSLVVGEVWAFPGGWARAMDGVLNFHQRQIVLDLAGGKIDPAHAGRMLRRMVDSCGVEPMLRSWSLLDNHDTDRLATSLPDPALRRFARTLQFTLPGAPLIYYGSEVGMTGAGDPPNRAPMRWDLVRDDNPDLAHTRALAALRQTLPALRIGEFEDLGAERLLAFRRFTDRARQSVFVLANPSASPVAERVQIPDGGVLSGELRCELTGQKVGVLCGIADATVPPRTVLVLTIHDNPKGGYTQYKRVE